MANDGRDPDRYLMQALQFEDALRAQLFRITRNTADVDELLQETYARLLVAGASAEAEVRSVRALAHTIARNLAIDLLRHRTIVPLELVAEFDKLNLLDERPPLDGIVSDAQELQLLRAAVQSLPPRCRQVFTLCKVYGWQRQQIADHLNISEETVKDHLTRAMLHLTTAVLNPRPAQDQQASTSRARRWRWPA